MSYSIDTNALKFLYKHVIGALDSLLRHTVSLCYKPYLTFYLPGQLTCMQSLVWVSSPAQPCKTVLFSGMWHTWDLLAVPCPHVTEQTQLLHAVQLAAICKKYFTVICIKCKKSSPYKNAIFKLAFWAWFIIWWALQRTRSHSRFHC